MPEQPTNTHHAPQIVRGVRRWFLLRHRWFRHLHRWQRWVVRLAIGVPLLMLVALVVITRSPLTRSIVLPQLEAATNLDITAEKVYVRANGRLVMDGAEFRIPRLPGPAGSLLRVDRLTADVDWGDAIFGSARVREITFERPVFRVSQSLIDETLNLAYIETPDRPPSSGGRVQLPRIVARDGEIQLGEHNQARFTLLKSLPVEGLLTAAPRGERGYTVGLTEFRRERGSLKKGFQIHGRIDDDSLALEMDEFSLDLWPPETFPRPVRQLFADLGLRGRVPKASFSFSDQRGMSAQLTLDGVELNLPIKTDAPDGQFMRMHAVKGSVTFGQDSVLVRADGSLEDLPYSVVLHYYGTTTDSPFECEIVSKNFHVEKAPKLLLYAPPLVAKRLADFSGPTATVDTRLVLRRRALEDGSPGPISFQGWMDVSNGRAAFEKFPYPFENLSAQVYFDNERVEVRGVRGTSPTGATLTAHATVAPANDDAQIDVWVDVQNAPIDRALEEAFGPGRDRVMHALFNREKHQKLVDTGLVLPPDREPTLRAELAALRAAQAGGAVDETATRRIADLETALAAPIFEFGGLADVSVRVHRPLGDDVEWSTEIDVLIERAGLVPEAFPLPVHVTGVRCEIREQDAAVFGGTYEGLRGGSATVKGSFLLPPRKDPGADPRPHVDIDLSGLPMDDLAINALPGEDGAPLKRILRGLNISGAMDGHVRIAPLDLFGRGPSGSTGTGFDAALSFAGASCSPADPGNKEAGPAVTDATGTLQATERSLTLTLDARAPEAAPDSQPIHIETSATFEFKRKGEGAPPRIDSMVRAPGADLRLPVERVVRVFSAKAADDLAVLRQKHQPAGLADIVTNVHVADHATRSVRLNISGGRRIEFDWLGGRVESPAAGGSVEVECVGGVAALFHQVAGTMRFDGKPAGDVLLNGWYRFAPKREDAIDASPPLEDAGRVLHVSATDGRFESPFLPAVLARPVGVDRLRTLKDMQPRGVFTAEIDIRGGGGEPLRVAGTVEPSRFALDIDGTAIEFEQCSGWVSFDGKQGTFKQLAGSTPNWSCTVDGLWRAGEGPPTSAGAAGGAGVLLDVTLGAQGTSLTPDARVILPEGLRKALTELKLTGGGPFALTDARLTLLTGVDRSQAWSRFDGAVAFENVALEAGAKVTGCDGRLTAHFERAPGGTPSFRIQTLADSLSIGAADAYDAKAVIQSGLAPGEVVVPLIMGECHNGRFAGRVRVAPAGDREKEYSASFQLSGVDFGALMHDLANNPPAPQGSEQPPPSAATGKPPPEPGSRGWLDAEFAVSGFVGVPETRRGRGAGRVSGQNVRVLNLPGIVPLIEVSNLAMPSNEALDYAEADFYVDGGLISFDRLSVFSKSIEIKGFGTMTWPQMGLDLRFNSRAARPIPMVSWLVTGLRNQLVATSVRGTARKPEVKLISMPGTRRMLGRVIGTEETERSRRLLELERRSSLSRHGIRPTTRGIRGEARVPESHFEGP